MLPTGSHSRLCVDVLSLKLSSFALPCVPNRLEAVFDELCATHVVQRLPVPGKHLHTSRNCTALRRTTMRK